MPVNPKPPLVIKIAPDLTDKDKEDIAAVVLRKKVRGSHMALKEYYEIVDEARPLSGFLPTHADFFYGNAFLIMKLLASFQVSERSEL